MTVTKEGERASLEFSEAAGKAFKLAGRATLAVGIALEPAGMALEPAGRALEPAGRASKPAERASEPAGKASESSLSQFVTANLRSKGFHAAGKNLPIEIVIGIPFPLEPDFPSGWVPWSKVPLFYHRSLSPIRKQAKKKKQRKSPYVVEL